MNFWKNAKTKYIWYFILVGNITYLCSLAGYIGYNLTRKFQLHHYSSYDNMDIQWRMFRQNLGLIVGGLVGLVLLSNGWRFLMDRIESKLRKRYRNAKRMVLRLKVGFYCVVGFGFVYGIHGLNGLVLLVVVGMGNYVIGLVFRTSRWMVLLSWVYNLTILFSTEYFFNTFSWTSYFGYWKIFSVIERSQGFYSWTTAFNMTFLRMISYNIDYRDNLLGRRVRKAIVTSDPSPLLKKYEIPGTYEYRVLNGSSLTDFGVLSYFAYLFYPPLYLAGPISTFNAFISHVKKRQTKYSWIDIGKYFLRVAFSFTCIEILLRYIHICTLSRLHKWAMKELSLLELIDLGYVSLVFLYLKFNCIWKTMRLMALLDGIEVPENMNRCIHCNYTFTGFWRSWHQSYNMWLRRYVYIPLGGNRKGFIRRIFNVFLIFSFVAIWHDLQLYLLAWGWLITLFYIPEAFGAYILSKVDNPSAKLHLRALGGGLNLMLLMSVNIIGFSLHLDGTSILWNRLLSQEGWILLSIGMVAFFLIAHLMIVIQEKVPRFK